jgi:hypothetical protein
MLIAADTARFPGSMISSHELVRGFAIVPFCMVPVPGFGLGERWWHDF